MLRMTIEGVGFDHLRQTVVVLKDWQGEKLLPIWIGPAEARAIQIELEGARPGRPLSHDLLLAIIAVVHGRVTRVVINDLQDATFYATIDIDTPKGTRHIDARPSDALAVAVRAKCPVFVDGGAINALIDAEEVNGLPSLPEAEQGANSDGDDEEMTRFRRLLGDE
jgi:bifunctional DNase/RNase